MSKNISFQRIILLLTLIIVIVASMVYLSQYLVRDLVHPTLRVILVVVLGGLLIYLATYRVLNFYLYRRIKLIYKMIRMSKVSFTKEEDAELADGGDALIRAEQEVGLWISEQQKEIQSLKKLENYRKSFLGDISHELKTPIFAVQGYIHTLLDGGLQDEQVNHRFLKKAAKNIERLETIVDDLDIIARLEDATMQLEFQSFDLKELTREVMESVEVQAKERNISILFKQGAEKSFNVFADREYIHTVLINLIVNSIKYGHDNGMTKVGFYAIDNHILVEIADNGIGIEDQHLKHLFDRFYRVDKSRNRERGGSGLGLSIVKHIVEAHKQTINVRSTPGIGTTMGFTLQKVR